MYELHVFCRLIYSWAASTTIPEFVKCWDSSNHIIVDWSALLDQAALSFLFTWQTICSYVKKAFVEKQNLIS